MRKKYLRIIPIEMALGAMAWAAPELQKAIHAI